MMKRYTSIKFALALLCGAFIPQIAHSHPRATIELRSSAFIPQSQRFRDIYGSDGFTAELEGGFCLGKHMAAWGNLDWYYKTGRSIGLNSPTNVDIVNFSLGLKFPFRVTNCLTVYIGAGPCFANIWLENKSDVCGTKRSSEFVFGGVLKTGINWFFTSHVFLDVFLDYTYLPTDFPSHVNIGGFKPGIGIGYVF